MQCKQVGMTAIAGQHLVLERSIKDTESEKVKISTIRLKRKISACRH